MTRERKHQQADTGKRAAPSKTKRTDGIEQWCKENGGVESVTYDEETGAPMRTFTMKLK